MYIIRSLSAVYHQCEALHLIKPQKELDSLPNAIISNEITVSTHDLANRSMADYAKLYAAYSD